MSLLFPITTRSEISVILLVLITPMLITTLITSLRFRKNILTRWRLIIRSDRALDIYGPGNFTILPDLTNPTNVPKPQGVVYAGDLMFKDLNEDGMIDDRDSTAIGYTALPEILFGITVNFSYKDFYLNTFWQGATHTSVNFGGAMWTEFAPNVYPLHMGRWVYDARDPQNIIDTRATATYPSLHLPSSPQTTTTSTFNLLEW